jgi:hypothetical protein
MSTAGSASNLVQAARDLSNDWQQTKALWHDIKSQEFEHNYLDVLPGHVDRTVAVLEELNLLLKKVRSECE